jgi:hypothetical protein
MRKKNLRKSTYILHLGDVLICGAFLFNSLFAILRGGDAEVVFEISIERAKRGISHLKGTLKYRFIRIIKKITRLVKSVDIEIRNIRYSR